MDMLAEGERTAARFDERDVVGLKYFGPIRKLLERLHGDAAHPNRTLHCDQYVALSHSPEGLELQLYAALIATLLIVLWTGRKPNRRTLTAVALYLQGWSSLDELNAFMARLTPTV
jgi:hypothetical protein